MGAPPAVDAAEAAARMKKMDLKAEEVDKFEKAFKDPEFVKLFGDYLNEIKDPAVKEETDNYLRQLEFEGRAEEVYGKGVQLITPEEGMVFKTVDTVSGRKAFINVCTSIKVVAATMRVEPGKRGTHVELPLSLGPARQGVDKGGAVCAVWDVVVHPDTLTLIGGKVAVRDMLAETAMDKIESVAKEVKLKRQYKVPRMKYKVSDGVTKPPVLALRGVGAGESVGGKVRPQPAGDLGVTGARPAPTATNSGAASAAPSTAEETAAAARSGFSFGKAAAGGPVNSSLAPHQAGYRHASGQVTPSWEVVHRGEVDLATTWGDAGRGLEVNTSCPKELVLRFHLPGLTSAAEVDLDVMRQSVTLSVPGRFLLPTTALPFAVDSKAGRAKFNKVGQRLEVTLPVLPPPAPPRGAARHTGIEEVSSATAPPAPDATAASTTPQAQTQPPAPVHQLLLSPQLPGVSDTDTATASCSPGAPGVQVSGAEDAAVAAGLCAAEAGGLTTAEQGAAPSPAVAEDAHSSGQQAGSPAAQASTSSEAVAQISDNERRWNEIHAHASEAAVQALPALRDGEEGTAAVCTSGETADVDDRAAGRAEAPAPAPPPPVLLKPRLTSSLAEELD